MRSTGAQEVRSETDSLPLRGGQSTPVQPFTMAKPPHRNEEKGVMPCTSHAARSHPSKKFIDKKYVLLLIADLVVDVSCSYIGGGGRGHKATATERTRGGWPQNMNLSTAV